MTALRISDGALRRQDQSRRGIDRAAVVTTAILQIFETTNDYERRPAIEKLLCDEFHDLAREVAADLGPVAQLDLFAPPPEPAEHQATAVCCCRFAGLCPVIVEGRSLYCTRCDCTAPITDQSHR